VTETLTSNGTYVYSATFTTAGAHTLLASYSGDTTHASSTGSVTVTVGGVSTGKGSFSLSATSVTVASGSAGTSTITVTPTGGYEGTVVFSLTTTSSALANACNGAIPNAVVTGTAAVTSSVTIDTNAANCLATGSVRKGSGKQRIHVAGMGLPFANGMGAIATIALLIVTALAGMLGFRARKLRVLAGVVLLAAFSIAFSGCGNSNSSNLSNPPSGTYTLTLTGTDSSSTTIPVATTTITLTIQ
jgi:hypothetical protein